MCIGLNQIYTAAAQYNNQYMFFNWRQLAKSLWKKFIIYFGVSGHGKGLVDTMSAFGVKGPLRKQIIINKDFFFLSAEEIHSF